jgi:ComF family protein
MQLTHIIDLMREIGAYALDTIAPPDPVIRKIEAMSASEFVREIESTSTGARSDGRNDDRPRAKHPPDDIVALFPYRNELMRTALVELKTFRNKKIEELIGVIMNERISKHATEQERAVGNQKTILIPIPMTKKSIRERGWNQCELIAREISKADGNKLFEIRTDLLAKTRETGDQVGKTRVERLESLKSCMEARNMDYIQGRNVVVIDDIVTTGATLSEAKRALLQAGARAVICVAVAF